jgi:hypothetical protein
LRTFVYVDGFNLYYGCLKGSPYKWLDLCALFGRILPAGYTLQKVKYFTARITALPNDPVAPQRQNIYLRALRAHCGATLEIHEGHFTLQSRWMPRADNPARFEEVLRSEEKGSDVNLAVEIVNDVWSYPQLEAIAIVSNDADLERAVKIARKVKNKKVLLYTPGAPGRRPVSSLTRWSTKQGKIDAGDLAASQLPSPIPGTALVKPQGW